MAIASGLGSSSGPSRPWQSYNNPQRSNLRSGGGTGLGGGKKDKFSAIRSIDAPYDMNAFTTVATHHDHSDRSSEEAIIHMGATEAPSHADDASKDDRFQIRTTTTVKVESHKFDDDDDEFDLSRGL